MTEAELLEVIAKAAREKVTSLDLSRKQIKTIPPVIGQLTSLTWLYLNNNQISEMPEEIVQLTNLTKLDLFDNQITEIPEAISQLSNLTKLNLYSNQITEIPEIISRLSNLTGLYLSNNQITEIPKAISQLSNLTALDLSHNQITEIPETISQLSNLTSLDLSHNQITEIPETISQLSNLTRLNLSYNQITEIPETISQLSNLIGLYLNNNQIMEIPKTISQISNLIGLYLNNNQIMEIPKTISQLSNLTELYLNNNQITEIPDVIANLTNLTELDLRGNSLQIPIEILNNYKKPAAILDFILEHKRQPLNEAKVILVGQGAVGKSSLVKRLIENKFDADERKTEGINICYWQVAARNEKVKLRVWDFGGQEIMHATHQFFLTERSLYLVIINTREDERANRLEYWLKLIEKLGKNAPVIVVGNKIDSHPLDLDQRGLQAKYPNIKAFLGTSCATGQGIDALRTQIAQAIAVMPHVFDTIPTRWLALKAQLEQDDRDYITYAEYEQKCIAEGITKPLSRNTLVRLLHELGIVLNFSDDQRLKDTNILNPEWVTGGVYKIINDNQLMTDQKGVLRWQDWPRIFQPKFRHEQDCYGTEEARQFILEMMQKFELCFPMETTDPQGHPDYLIPDLLPKEEPYTEGWEDSYKFEYHYEKVLPNSVISRFIVKAHRHIARLTHPTYWRTGVILASKDGNKAYVKADLEDAKIFVRISGNPSTRRDFLAIIRDIFDIIHEIPQLNPDERIALPDNPKITVSYSHLLKLEERGVIDYLPEGSDHNYNIRELLNGISAPKQNSDRDSKPQNGSRALKEKRKEKQPGIYRYALPAKSSLEDKKLFKAQVERIKMLNPDWIVDYDRPRIDEDDAILIIHKHNHLQNQAAYIITRSLSEMFGGFQ